MATFIDIEIARQCPNPTASSQIVIYDIPLVLMGGVLLAQRELDIRTSLKTSGFWRIDLIHW